MLTSQENEILTQVGPAAPMGRMMRRFWLPVCTSAQLPEPDSDPLRARSEERRVGKECVP